MARSNLANSSSNLNLSNRQIQLLQQIFFVGNQMSKVMNPDHPMPMAKDRTRLRRKWSNLMIAFAEMLL